MSSSPPRLLLLPVDETITTARVVDTQAEDPVLGRTRWETFLAAEQELNFNGHRGGFVTNTLYPGRLQDLMGTHPVYEASFDRHPGARLPALHQSPRRVDARTPVGEDTDNRNGFGAQLKPDREAVCEALN